jgi:hypothetical protein|tara:strand:- start:35 stop:208 length:174 start_codon:yes stop_codon:yes gene_type:complete
MINAIILSITFGFGFLTGAVLGVIAMLKPLRKTQKALEEYTKLHKNKYDEDKEYHAY